MEKIRLIIDSACDIEDMDKSYVTMLPMTVSFGEEEYKDGVTITHQQFYEKLIEHDALPVTSLISPSAFEQEYEKAKQRGEDVLVITLSSKLSGTWQSAKIAQSGYADHVRVVDSMNATIGEQILVRYAMRLIEHGYAVDGIVSKLESVKGRIRVLGLLDTLEYLKKGGRISKTAAFVGGALNIKPVVTVQNGEVVLLGKARGSKNGNNFLISEIAKANGVDFSMPFCLGYTGLNDTTLQKYIKDSESLWTNHTATLPITQIGATIGTHVGPNGIAVAFFANEP